MLKSMTGFGKATVESDTISVSAEIKSLNSKFLDIYCRIPRTYSEREIEIRNQITQALERGKVEFNLNIAPIGESSAGTIVNRAVVKAYFRDLEKTAQELSFDASPTELLRMALQMPNTYLTDASTNEQQTAQDWAVIQQAVRAALEKCNEFRLQEGQVLENIFRQSIERISHLLAQVAELDKDRIPAVRERLRKNVRDLVENENFDPNRFEQELIYFIEKFDISEEKVRLQNHLTYFVETLQSKDSNGKKLNFIAQEMGREINTIGSKANDAGIQRVVVEMKDELEKIKEQTANII
ncbi:MAG: YicC family protein [Cytophagia bacterium]|nr:MAG: YicC family protein [Runella sp.]TAG24360.1 MAG: YicC family protein [Cytophagales bacterium]TAG35197.1 MAG: YicC family protein [Cytophagia bacterium]TAG77129.1 MAG: YicC family protein [Cytophagales bacterium]